jgi:hypothetical protein
MIEATMAIYYAELKLNDRVIARDTIEADNPRLAASVVFNKHQAQLLREATPDNTVTVRLVDSGNNKAHVETRQAWELGVE